MTGRSSLLFGQETRRAPSALFVQGSSLAAFYNHIFIQSGVEGEIDLITIIKKFHLARFDDLAIIDIFKLTQTLS